jgi:hypothetical protein
MPLGTEQAHHILMAQQRPSEIIAVGDRAASAHPVIGGDLVGENRLGARIPVGRVLCRSRHRRIVLAPGSRL